MCRKNFKYNTSNPCCLLNFLNGIQVFPQTNFVTKLLQEKC